MTVRTCAICGSHSEPMTYRRISMTQRGYACTAEVACARRQRDNERSAAAMQARGDTASGLLYPAREEG